MGTQDSERTPTRTARLERPWRLALVGTLPVCLLIPALLYAWQPHLAGPASAVLMCIWLICLAAGFRFGSIRSSPLQWSSLHQLSTGLASVSIGGRVTWANAALCRIAGTRPEETANRNWSELRTDTVWQAVGQQLAQPPPSDSPQSRWHFVGVLQDAAGQPRAVLVRLTYVPQPSRTYLIELIETTELTETAAPVAIETQMADYHGVLEAFGNPALTIDHRGRILDQNEAARQKLHIDHPTKAHILQFVAAEDRERLVATLTRLRDTRQCVCIDELNLAPQGVVSAASRSPATFRLTPLSRPAGGTLVSVLLHPPPTREPTNTDARFSRIFHSSPDAILIMRDEDSTILDFNAGFTRLLGYTREQAIGVKESDLDLWVHAAERERIMQEFRTQKECDGAETKLRTREGDTLFAELSLRYIEIDGELCVLCIGRDVSKRAMAEAALKESQHKFQQVFSRSPDGIVIIRQQDLTICDINDAFVAASGYERDQLVNYSLPELDILADHQDFERVSALLARDGQFSNIELVFKTRHGEEIPALVSATLLEVGEEPCILCIAKDLRQMRDTEEQLRVSEDRFRGVFENAPIGILLLDMDGRIFEANRFAAELLEYSDAAMEQLHVSRLVPTEERSRYKEMLERLKSGRADTLRTEQRMLCASGLEIWTNMNVVLQRSREGNPSYCIVQIADITETKVSQQRMERMAFYDILTDLANRRLFYDRLEQVIEHCRRSERLAALLYLDLDQFKRVNDTLGHETGDALLRAVAQRLTQSVRKDDTVGRPGGDEFTILLSDIKSASDASLVAEKILALLQQPIAIGEHQLVVTTSIGITIVPTDGTDPTILMKNADLAMYRAKEIGRNTYQFYSEEMNTNSARRLQTEYELRRALDAEEFVLYYQPKVRLRDQKVVGVECLLRWQHPERGLLTPGEFMDIAEETGIIVEMGNWVIDSACAAAIELAAATGTPVDTAVNISSRQFRDPNLVRTIRQALRTSGLDPRHLEVEITETMLMHDMDAASQTVRELHDLGVKLAIDDFGTGYSSLSYLKKFPIDTVKVDRSFVMDIPGNPDDMAITSAVIAMAHRLNMQVVAEGVETPQQLEFLSQQGCEYAQGFLFSRPVELAAVKQLLAPNVRLLRG